MKIFKVGGAVRDELLGLQPRDLDFVVLDSNSDEMKRKGFIQVGSTFEVFLHPETKNEYVLARSLEEDLERRDLTINSMAKDEDGNLIDFFNGQKDLASKILRHTSTHFGDDPLRIYRLAQFKAQYPDFTIAHETLALCRDLSLKSSFKNLNGERILGEFKEALRSREPENFFNTLDVLGTIYIHFLHLHDWQGLSQQAKKGIDSLQLFSFLMRKNTLPEIDELAKRLVIQNDWIEAAKTIARFHSLPDLHLMKAEEILNFFYLIDAFRKPHLISRVKILFEDRGSHLERIFYRMSEITMKDIDPAVSGKQTGEAIRKVRLKKLESYLEEL